jgi:hypothetical protein
MTVRLVAKVLTDSMEPIVLYPRGENNDERIALLTGIVQLVSAALERTDPQKTGECTPHFMKSANGVIGYCSMGGDIVLCEGDAEHETNEAIMAVVNGRNIPHAEVLERVEKAVQKRGKEIGDLWR